MSAHRVQRVSVAAQAKGDRGPGAQLEADADVSFEARPLPSDPMERAEIRAMVEQGLADARADLGVDVDEVMARWDSMLAARLR